MIERTMQGPGNRDPRTAGNFTYGVEEFLKENALNLDIKKRAENVEILSGSKNKEIVGEYVIANDFTLKTEGAKVTLAYQNGNDRLLVVKEIAEERMKKLGELHKWGNLTVEEYLKEKGFNDPNVLLPIEIIKKDGKVYRFYEAMDMDLEKYLETHNKFPIKEGVVLILRACQGIQSLNEVGVVNIDFSPLNTMLTSKSLRLIDLDGASVDNNNSGVFSRNYLGGNRFALAPELFEERPVFNKTVDVYAASSNLYRLIMGDWPYNIEQQTRGMSFEDKMAEYKIMHESGEINFAESIPAELQKVIKKGMSPNPQDRYQTMEEFMIDLLKVTEKN